jgi:hypothetical protein
MSLWLLIMLFGLIKLPLIALMLWLTLRDDATMSAQGESVAGDDDGGLRTPPAGPHGPHPLWPTPARPRGARHATGGPRSALPPRRGGSDCAPPPRAPRRVPTRLTLARGLPIAR